MDVQAGWWKIHQLINLVPMQSLCPLQDQCFQTFKSHTAKNPKMLSHKKSLHPCSLMGIQMFIKEPPKVLLSVSLQKYFLTRQLQRYC